MKKILAVILILALAFSIPVFAEDEEQIWWWDAVTAYANGEDASKINPDLNSLDRNPQGTDYAQHILVRLAKGEPTSELSAALAETQKENGSFGAVNSQIWGIIALEMTFEKYDRAKALEFLLSKQFDDGGFALTGESGDPDMTGMALIAMSFFQSELQKNIEKSVEFLKNAQTQSGGYESISGKEKLENANSISMAILGLTAVGIDPLSFTKDGKTMLDALKQFETGNGMYAYLLDPKETDYFATSQVKLALADIKNKESAFKILGKKIQEVEVKIRVEGIEKTVFNETLKINMNLETSAATAFVFAMKNAGIDYEYKPEGIITSIDGVDQAKFGGFDGWVYNINGEAQVVGINKAKLCRGDELVVYYGGYDPETLVPTVEFKSVGGDVWATVSAKYFDWNDQKEVTVMIEDAEIKVVDQIFKTDKDGKANIGKIDKNDTVYVSKNREDGYPLLVRTDAIKPEIVDDGFVDDGEIADWAKEFVELAKEYGFVAGNENNEFLPKKPITRAEFVALLVRMIGINTENIGTFRFKDVKESDWYFSVVHAAKESGIIQGDGDVFRPNGSLKREELAAMIARAVELEKGPLDVEFDDFNSVSDWAKEAVALVASNGIIVGSDGKYNPKAIVTREMGTVVIMRVFEGYVKE